MSLVIENVLVRHDPVGQPVPVLFDSPHSGTVYPDDFTTICPFPALRQAEDTHVDALFAAAPTHGATLLLALFPRTCIDLNRAVDDIDPATLDGRWPTRLRPTDKSAAGMGLIRMLCRPGLPLYPGRLPVSVVEQRIERYYRPYHAQMRAILDGFVEDFGGAWHVDCHSMPSGADGAAGADFVVGDRDGSTAERAFVARVVEVLRGFGYKVARNDPYKGVELLARYANPARGRHSIQLEINRRLYMNEETLEKHAGFDRLRAHLDTLIGEVCAYARTRIAARAAE